MLGLINEMLEISRFEQGTSSSSCMTVDIAELIELAAGGFAEQMQKAGNPRSGAAAGLPGHGRP